MSWPHMDPADSVGTMNEKAMDSFSSTPMGWAGQPSEIAACFVFLASQDSALISGQSLHPNCGVVVNGQGRR